MKRFGATLLVILLAVPRILPQAQALDPVRLQLKWHHQFQFAGYYAAKEKGFYAEAGLDVTLLEGDPDVSYTDEVVSGAADYGVNNTDLLIDRSKGKPVVVLAAVFQHSPTVLLTLKGRGFEVPSDFAGRSVMIVPGAEAEVTSMFRYESIPLEAVRFRPHSWDLDDLLSGRVDAVTAYITNEPIILKASGIDYTLIRPLTYGIDFYGDCLFTTESEVRRRPGRVKAFLEASVRGWDYAMHNPEEICDLILAKYSTRKPRDVLLQEAEAMRELILPDLVPIGFMNPGRWKHIGDTFASLGSLPADYSLEGFLFDPRAPRLDPRVIQAGLVFAGLALFAALAYILALRSFNRLLAFKVETRTAILRETNRLLEQEILRGAEREKRLAASLSEKEVLLREIHHRVKNNLQIIVSILNLQAEKGDEVFLRDLRSRVVGMALVHEHLYSGADLGRVDMGQYMGDLVSDIAASYSRPDLSIRTDVRVADVSLSIDQAVSLGLIVAELVSNSMKHAFTGRRSGSIELALGREDGSYVLSIGDDGPIAETGPQSASAGSAAREGLGLRLVEALAAQLRGDLSVDRTRGYRTSLRFPAALNGT
ncbi:MAG TPA: ABC transporter substrate-binding protein [Spirochaetia bacterium]|nr:ABC transporter substrate-binding protein [Spirochaetales bacterium]HRY79663.1 ABC transporter substrate-binding protein [Spirochaetia bacterium]HRZ88311.1 ABC transporter substrate-binding protein [Spirochaetia bacterium]